MRKKLICIFFSLITFLSVGCKSNNLGYKSEEEFNKNVKSIYFNNRYAMDVAKEYMEALKSSDLNKIRELSVEEINDNIILPPSGDVVVTGIKESGFSQMGGKAIFKYDVTRAKEGEPTSYLEEYYLEVEKTQDNKYKVSMLKAIPKYNVFKENEKLKIRKGDEVKINTLIELNNIPDKVYPKENIIDIAKVDVPKKGFSALGISFTGEKVAISTYSGDKSYIGVLDVEDSKSTATKEGEDEGKKEEKDDNDKIVGKKIITLDVLEDSSVKSFNFSDDDGYIVTNYEKGGARRFKVYKSSGDIIPIGFDDIFSEKLYNLVYEKIQDNFILMEVTPLKTSEDVDQGLTGKYKISLKDFKVQKL